jgi:hypothetical protein
MRKMLGLFLVASVILGAYAVLMPGEAQAKPPGGGSCGKCPCAPRVGNCVLDSCHLLYPAPDCLWDCHYVCPYPG